MDRKSFTKILTMLPVASSITNLSGLEKFADQLPFSQKMPVLFLGHGSPMNAIEENQFVKGFRDMAKSLPKPKAILCISAHYYTRGSKLTAMAMPPMIYDMYGFPEALYQVKYPAPGSPALALETVELLKPFTAELDEKWGLDHGAWSVLRHLYPEADVPVVQMSIDATKPAQYHYELAAQLKGLRQKGILIIGSGNIIHNLRLVDFQNMDKVNYGFDWAIEAHTYINQWLGNRDFKPLLEYQNHGRALQLAVPTPDHFLPMIYALGLMEPKDEMLLFNDELLAGSLSMTSFKLSEV